MEHDVETLIKVVIVVGIPTIIYFLIEINSSLRTLSSRIEEAAERISPLEDGISEIKSDIGNLESAIDAITPDSARVDELVRHGFDAGDAWEWVITKKHKGG